MANSWCRFKAKKKGKNLIDYAREKNFREAYELFKSLETTMVIIRKTLLKKFNQLIFQKDLLTAVLACNMKKIEDIVTNKSAEIKLNFKNMVS